MDRLRATDITYLKGVGPARARILGEELGIKTLYDLLYHFPSHYIDRSQFHAITSLRSDMTMVQIKGRFVSLNILGEGARTRLVGLFTDGLSTMEVVWFKRIKAIREQLRIGNLYVIFGKPAEYNGRWSMVHPEIDSPEDVESTIGLRGVYPLTEKLRNRGITSRTLFSLVRNIIALHLKTVDDPIPADLRGRLRLMDKRDALMAIHNPRDNDQLIKARERLKFEELFYLQLNILSYSRRRSVRFGGHCFTKIGHYFNSFYSQCLPFELTGAQKRVIREIRRDMNSGRQMNRLLQGDVGSGKTLVALMCMLIALDNGCQACLMAPTEILATQHFETISQLAAQIGVNVKLLTGSTPKKSRDLIHSQLTDGSLHILIGTHAVISI